MSGDGRSPSGSGSAAPPAAQQPRSSIGSRVVGTFGANLALAVLSFVNVILTARVLGPDGRGTVALMTAIAMFSGNVALIGIGEANANLAGRDSRLRAALVANSFAFATVFGGAAIVVVALLIGAFPALGGDAEIWILALALSAIPILILQAYLQLLLQAGYAFGLTNAAWVLGPIVNLLGNAVAALLGALTVGTVVATWVAGQALGLAVLVYHLLIRERSLAKPDVALAKIALAFGVRTHAGRVMMVGNYRLDQWILGSIGTSSQLGLYSVAVALAETLFYLPTSVSAAQRPDLVRASRAEAARQVTRGLRLTTLLTAVLGLGLFVVAPYLVPLLFGEEFSGSIVNLRILVLGAFGVVAMKLLIGAITAQGWPGRASLGVSVALLTTLVLDVALIPAYGDVGASIASSIAYTAGGIALGFIAIRLLGCAPRDFIPRSGEALALARRLRRERA